LFIDETLSRRRFSFSTTLHNQSPTRAMGRDFPIQTRNKGRANGFQHKTNRKAEAAAKKKVAEDAKIEKINARKAKEDEAKEKLDEMKTKVETLEKAATQPQPQPQPSYYAQPAQPSYYSQPAPQPQAYNPPQKVGFWERAADTYTLVNKFSKMNNQIKAADKGTKRSGKRLLNSTINYLAEAERYKAKYNK